MQRGGCNPTGFGASASQELASGLRLAQHCEACPAMRDQSVRCPLAMSERIYACLWYAKLPAFAEASLDWYSHIVKCQCPSFQLSQFYPSPKLGQLFYPAEMSVNTLSVNALSVKAAAGVASLTASIRPARSLTVGSALSWALVLPFSWVG